MAKMFNCVDNSLKDMIVSLAVLGHQHISKKLKFEGKHIIFNFRFNSGIVPSRISTGARIAVYNLSHRYQLQRQRLDIYTCLLLETFPLGLVWVSHRAYSSELKADAASLAFFDVVFVFDCDFGRSALEDQSDNIMVLWWILNHSFDDFISSLCKNIMEAVFTSTVAHILLPLPSLIEELSLVFREVVLDYNVATSFEVWAHLL